MRDKNFNKLIEKVFGNIVIGLGLLIFLVFTYYSFRFTTFFGMEYQRIPHFTSDSLVKNFVLVFCMIGIPGVMVVMLRKIKKQRLLQNLLLGAVMLGIFAFECWWIKISQTVPGADQRYIWVGAQEFMQGNYRYLQEGKYFQFHPHQLPLLMFCQCFMKLFHVTSFQAFKYFNAVCVLVAVFFLWKIFCEFSKKDEERIGFIIASAFIFPLFLYSTFIYSEIVSLTFMLMAFFFALKFVKKDCWYWGLGSFVFISLSVMCRKNMLVPLIALLIFLFLSFLKKKKWAYLLLSFLMIVSCLSIGKFAVNYYEKQSGIDIGSGVPSISYIAMGMQEGLLAEGWFNKYTEETYIEAGYNAELSKEITKKAISERIREFKNNPTYFFNFYKNKILKQWNEPTYGGFINNSYHDERGFSEVTNSMYYGKLHNFFVNFCNGYQLLIFLGVLIYLLFALRQGYDVEQNFLFVVFLGGFFFHILWEGDSRYALPYFVVLIPYGVWGISRMCQWAMQSFKSLKKA